MTEAEFEYFTTAEFTGQAEWVGGGVIVPMSTSLRHASIQAFLLTLLYLFYAQRKLGQMFGENVQVRLPDGRSRRTPDLVFLSQQRLNLKRDTFIDGAPDLVMEIVSPDSVARDWREKYYEYQTAGVREYWIVDPLSEQIEAYALNDELQYMRIAPVDGAIHSGVLAGLRVQPAWLWGDELPSPLDVLAQFQ